MNDLDLLVVGSGPAGMSAAITGASEGLRIGMIDGSDTLGGRARESSAIENYPGFPEGNTGAELMRRFADQAIKFHTEIQCPVMAAGIRKDGDRVITTTDDGTEYVSRAVMLAMGLSYRRLVAANISRFMGTSVFYGLPDSVLQSRRRCSYVIVGGANSAGQAVMRLARNPGTKVTMLIRRTIHDQMSQYLIERIRKMPNVEVLEGAEVSAFHGDRELSHVELTNGEAMRCGRVLIFIGAVPKTQWLRPNVQLDSKGFVQATNFETSMAGVYAAGDVRLGSIKRVATSIGEGAAAVQSTYRFLL